jgi:hypothetical protein
VKGRVEYVNPGRAETQSVSGVARERAHDLIDADRKDSHPLARRAALKRLASRLPFRAMAYFLYSYILRGGFLQGRDGLVYCAMKSSE